MEINSSIRGQVADPIVDRLLNVLADNDHLLGLEEAEVYYQFPILKDSDDEIIISQILIASRRHGTISIATSSIRPTDQVGAEITIKEQQLDQVYTLIFSKLIRNRKLKTGRTDLVFPMNSLIYAPNLGAIDDSMYDDIESKIVVSDVDFSDFLKEIQVAAMPLSTYEELRSTLEGAKGLIRPRVRTHLPNTPNSKGEMANRIEAEIGNFDREQKDAAIPILDGVERLRGLAGSGKTVVLAMKAALTHLRDPDAFILYTFHTRSLYQHIKRLITRFYRQYDDKDPDWTKLRVLHAWGGKITEGVYSRACISAGIESLTFSQASGKSVEPFNYACTQLLSSGLVTPAYDYVLIDEGQDFPASFIRLCHKLVTKERLVFAYDDLQTIFQTSAPTIEDIFGKDSLGRPLVHPRSDIVLHKCYRNPREILVCAHALGFGIYGPRIVQMLENHDQWEDVGYRVVEGDFISGSRTIVERPVENGLRSISENQEPSAIVSSFALATMEDEVTHVAQAISKNLADGLFPDDILAIVVDDRMAKQYLGKLESALLELNIKSNNVHAEVFVANDFQRDGTVTLSTVHKAKGNESFMVYVMGVDALFNPAPSVKSRNMLFTAMTRAKGWVQITGVGDKAEACINELNLALAKFPRLEFTYPNPEDLKVLKRDLADEDAKRQRVERLLQEAQDTVSPEEFRRIYSNVTKRKRPTRS